jgi:hypothetical protein
MHGKEQFGLSQIVEMYIELLSLKGILAKVKENTKFLVDMSLSFYYLCLIIGCQFITSEESRFKVHWKKHSEELKEDVDSNEVF